eukprot:1261915-Pyramimonas_sp.AAC.1
MEQAPLRRETRRDDALGRSPSALRVLLLPELVAARHPFEAREAADAGLVALQAMLQRLREEEAL